MIGAMWVIGTFNKVAKVASDVRVYYVLDLVLNGSKIVIMVSKVAIMNAYLSNMVEYATSIRNATNA